MQEPSDEDALAAPPGSDPVVAVVPVAAPDERQAVRAGGERAVDGPQAVIEQGALLCRYGRQPVRLGLSEWNGKRLKERNPLVEDSGISGRFHVLGDRVREPEEVVRAVRADAAPARRGPPVLNVALHQLSRPFPQEMLAGQVGPREQERKDVLELVAEAVRPAQLVAA